jgi:hypothetical protein
MKIEDGSYTETAELQRSTEGGIDHLVFVGTTGWRYRIYPDQVTEEELPVIIEHLRGKSWMTTDLLAQFEAQALALRHRTASN